MADTSICEEKLNTALTPVVQQNAQINPDNVR